VVAVASVWTAAESRNRRAEENELAEDGARVEVGNVEAVSGGVGGVGVVRDVGIDLKLLAEWCGGAGVDVAEAEARENLGDVELLVTKIGPSS